MQIKYIVYYPAPQKPPKVALWFTSDGSMTHIKYAEEHKISPQSFSSLGYANYSPLLRRYKLEHYQSEPVISIKTFLSQIKSRKRDMLLVQRELQRNPIFKNPTVMQGSYQDFLAFQKAKNKFIDD